MDESTVSWKTSLEKHSTPCRKCVVTVPMPYTATDGSTTVRCKTCGTAVGRIPKAETRLLHKMSVIVIDYKENTHYISRQLRKNPTWEVIMTAEQPKRVEEIDSERVIKLFPGHLVFESKEARAAGSTCSHRLILERDGRSARCVLCDGIRTLDDEEVQAIDAAQQAGVIFLRWEDRLRAMEHLRMVGPKKRRGRRRKGSTSTPSQAVETKIEIPAGFIPVAEAAKQLGMDSKSLRKKIRKKVYEGVKVGGRVYVKIPR